MEGESPVTTRKIMEVADAEGDWKVWQYWAVMPRLPVRPMWSPRHFRGTLLDVEYHLAHEVAREECHSQRVEAVRETDRCKGDWPVPLVMHEGGEDSSSPLVGRSRVLCRGVSMVAGRTSLADEVPTRRVEMVESLSGSREIRVYPLGGSSMPLLVLWVTGKVAGEKDLSQVAEAGQWRVERLVQMSA